MISRLPNACSTARNSSINHIENPNLLATKIIVPHKLIQREICCPPPEI